MKDITYLLSIKELLEGSEELLKAACDKLDEERLRKARSITNERGKAESIGAGLLLQLGIQELLCGGEGTSEIPVQHLTVSQAVERLGSPINIEYSYSERKKPGFRNFPWYFNLSHSGEYVFCVFSDEEIGVDIQQKGAMRTERILRRFFTGQEQELWDGYETQEEREDFFYRMWTRKEAYGKLTGEGIGAAVSKNMSTGEAVEPLGIYWKHYEVLPGYCIVVCKRMEERRSYLE